MLVMAGFMLKDASDKLNNFNIFGGTPDSSTTQSDDTLKQQVCGGSGAVTEYAKQQGWCN